MMWTAKPHPSDRAWEPIELVILKQKLAKLTSSICKCISDRPVGEFYLASSVHVNPNDKEVQVKEQRLSSVDRFTQASQSSIRRHVEELTHSLAKDALCPSCFVTMNLLRGGALKILKDEESETKHHMFSRDKATEKIVNSLEKTTSFTNHPRVACFELSGLCDSESSLNHEVTRNQHQVKFEDVTMASQKQMSATDVPPCVCLAKFVDSIRPPAGNSNPYCRSY